MTLEWRPASWDPDAVLRIELRLEAADGGTLISIRHSGLDPLLGGDAGETAGWFAPEAVAPLLQALTPARFGDWLTDRRARRPSGAQARDVYRDPLYHRPNFRMLLELLLPGPGDHLLEVGCGGGAFLEEALRSGCRAAAVDHSPEMVRLAREVNRDKVSAGRLEVVEASADSLPFADASFTCATMTGVLGFLPDPVAALSEIRRVLTGGGRLAMYGSDPALRGTPAAPEPMASRLRFYDDAELEQLGRDAGFTDVRVERHDLERHARDAGVPAEDVPLFAGGAPFLLAHKS